MQKNVHRKLVPDPFLILVNNPKQTLHAIIFFKKRYFKRGLSKKPFPFNTKDYEKTKRAWN